MQLLNLLNAASLLNPLAAQTTVYLIARTEGGRTFIAKAVKLWNSLPDKLKVCLNVKSFMRAYTSHLSAMNADLDHFTVN